MDEGHFPGSVGISAVYITDIVDVDCSHLQMRCYIKCNFALLWIGVVVFCCSIVHCPMCFGHLKLSLLDPLPFVHWMILHIVFFCLFITRLIVFCLLYFKFICIVGTGSSWGNLMNPHCFNIDNI